MFSSFPDARGLLAYRQGLAGSCLEQNSCNWMINLRRQLAGRCPKQPGKVSAKERLSWEGIVRTKSGKYETPDLNGMLLVGSCSSQDCRWISKWNIFNLDLALPMQVRLVRRMLIVVRLNLAALGRFFNWTNCANFTLCRFFEVKILKVLIFRFGFCGSGEGFCTPSTRVGPAGRPPTNTVQV